MATLKMPVWPAPAYDRDFHAWSQDQAARLRRDRPGSVDWENIAEEIEGLGRSDKRALGSDLKIVLEHLIKWRYQPEKRSDDWRDSIDEHRDRIARILDDSPSLAAWPNEVLAAEYQRARRKALRDTGLPTVTVPAVSPFSAEQIIDPDYWPD
jgi:hypothetical protein